MPAQTVVPALPAPARQCGRCQGALEADPELFFQTDWVLCPQCAEVLLPSRQQDRSYRRSRRNDPAGAPGPT
jgi:hypothetical protein